MTYSFQQDFDDRKRQVRHYLAVVLATERSASLIASPVEKGRLLTLRAGTFLVLYNLIEATTRGAIEAIHDKVTSEAVEFGKLSMNLRVEVIKRFRNQADPAIHHTMVDFPSTFVSVALDQGIKMSGTVDAKAIKKLAETYGFSKTSKSVSARGGADLLAIKRNRNDLAHGLKTFEQIGSDYTSTDLVLMSRRAMRYMGDIVENIVSYLDNKYYLE